MALTHLWRSVGTRFARRGDVACQFQLYSYRNHCPPRAQPELSCRHVATQQQSSAPSYPGMERWRGKAALVTGASSGIGYETAKQLTQLGMNVVGCARNIARIEVYSYKKFIRAVLHNYVMFQFY